MLEEGCDYSHIAWPVFVAAIHGQMKLKIISFTPFIQFVFEEQFCRVASSIQDYHSAEQSSFIQHLVNQRAQRGKTQTTRSKEQIFPTEFLNRETPSKRPPHPH